MKRSRNEIMTIMVEGSRYFDSHSEILSLHENHGAGTYIGMQLKPGACSGKQFRPLHFEMYENKRKRNLDCITYQGLSYQEIRHNFSSNQ